MELWQVLGIAMIAALVATLLMILLWIIGDLLVFYIINKRYKKWCLMCLKEKITNAQKKIAKERLLNVLIEFAEEQVTEHQANPVRDDNKEEEQ